MKREWIGGLPASMAKLPVDHRGFPVPYFVQWQAGKPLFPVMDPRKMALAIKQDRCWVCGGRLFANKAFVLGPMCCINTVNSEPPSHVECAEFSALNCPFLSKPRMKRVVADGMYHDQPVVAPAGIMIERNPGVTCVWVTKKFVIERYPDGPLWRVGEPVWLEFYANSRKATLEEVLVSVETGAPRLLEAALPGGAEEVGQLLNQIATFGARLVAHYKPAEKPLELAERMISHWRTAHGQHSAA